VKPEPIATNDQIDRWLIRTHLKPEAQRVVTAVFWGRYTVEDATRELRGIAFMLAGKCKVEPALADDVAISAVDEEMQRQEAEHQATLEYLAQAAFIAIRDGADLAKARRVVAAEAAQRPLAPPLPILTAAIEAAAQQARRAEYWWKTRERAE
jgi:hypothetical protein